MLCAGQTVCVCFVWTLCKADLHDHELLPLLSNAGQNVYKCLMHCTTEWFEIHITHEWMYSLQDQWLIQAKLTTVGTQLFVYIVWSCKERQNINS